MNISEYLQVRAAATKLEVSQRRTVVVLIVQIVVITTVILARTKIQAEEYFTADMKFTLNCVGTI